MDMMRIGADGKNLMCRNCLERKAHKEPAKTEAKAQMQGAMKEYFCKSCKYNFSRAKHLSITTCPYCGSSSSVMAKGSTAKIIADASRMK